MKALIAYYRFGRNGPLVVEACTDSHRLRAQTLQASYLIQGHSTDEARLRAVTPPNGLVTRSPILWVLQIRKELKS